jgi:hypothetical protein
MLVFNGWSHPVHITITNIEPDAQKGVFEVSIKVFTDDLEHAILQQSQKNIGFIKNTPSMDSEKLILQYINTQFQILINNKPISSSKVKLTKYSNVENATWLYLEFRIPSKIQQLSIVNNLLNHLYPDMTNLVIIKWNENEQGLTFTKSKTKIDIII